MPEPSTLALFAGAAMALLIIPGPAVLYIVARSVEQGRRAGVVSAAGVATGSLVHVAGAALGLSAILMSSATAFTTVKLAGAAYLFYLGLRSLLRGGAPHEAATIAPASLRRVFAQGVVVNILNPKVALFFFAFLPQFVDPARGPVAVQIMFLGCLYAVLSVSSDSMYALLAGAAGGWLKSNGHFRRGQHYLAGGIYLALGTLTALSGGHRKA
ncbi:MAG TPA: LysE family translocator [Thermomicrobiales bacterium]|mgnify:CR=1 FL=1|nr:LysE family translocator [Thermomicrobiales bacterium]